MRNSRYCSRCGSVLRAGQTHRNRKECQVAARENSNAGMTVMAMVVLVPVAFLIVGSEIVSRAPRPINHSGVGRDNWQIVLIFSRVFVASVILVYAADRFWKRK